jgi:hypothetical protein
VIFLLAAGGRARDIYVSWSGTNNYPFTNWPDAATNIQWAVNAGTNGDTVWISNGTYVLTNQITINSNITVAGFTNNGPVIVDGNNLNRCFLFAASRTGTLANLFITRGYINDCGGGAYVYGGVVRDCIFSNNVSVGYYGGGLEVNAVGQALVQRCIFIGNTAYLGGGMYIQGSSILDQCRFLTNTAMSEGGGIYAGDGKSVITNCVFISNVASNRGGGVRLENGTSSATNPCLMMFCTFASNVVLNSASGYGGGIYVNRSWIISNCYFSNNIATNNGGGIYLIEGTVLKNSVIARNRTLIETSANSGGGGIYMGGNATVVQECIIEENMAGYWGGGVFMFASTLRNCLIRNNIASGASGGSGGGIRFSSDTIPYVCNCTIVSNYAKTYGGGIYNGVGDSYYSFVENTIIYGNTCGTAAYSNYYNTSTKSIYSNCCFAPAMSAVYTNVNTVTNNPLFVESASGNYRLSRESPCVNAGANRDWMTNAVDLDGHGRIDRFSGIVDMGCFEYLPSGMMVTVP